ncbi:Neurotrypsin, partial [Geodia barretti]
VIDRSVVLVPQLAVVHAAINSVCSPCSVLLPSIACTMRSWILLLPVFMELFAPAHCQNYRDGDVRLVGGSYQWEGRVEVYMSGEWGTITDSDWTDDDAVVVCRKLGHFKAGARAYSNAYFGEGQGSINLDSVQCSGSEYNLTECVIGSSGSGTSHSMDVGVQCQPADGSYRNGDLRLVGGPHNWEGRVEVWNRTWGAVSDSQWSTPDANVVCKQLKHSDSGAVIPCCNNYGVASGAILITEVVCTGSETRIEFCYYQMNTDSLLSHEYDVLVQCQEGNDTSEGDIRLVGGTNHWEGRVEVFLSREWGTVYDYRAYTADAVVVCRQLGYSVKDVRERCCSVFGEGTGPIHFQLYRSCGGGEFRLIDCGYNRDVSQTRYSHSRDWGVFCSIVACRYGDMRLADGGTEAEGRVELCIDNRWGTVCDNRWNENSTAVACKHLGFSEIVNESRYFSSDKFGKGSGPYSLTTSTVPDWKEVCGDGVIISPTPLGALMIVTLE